MNNQTHRFYNNISLLYPLIDLFLKSKKHKLFQEINALPNGQLLDVGVGNGRHLPLYKRHRITGIDTSPAMLKLAEKQTGNSIKLAHMNGEELWFQDQAFDYVVLSHVLAVVNNPEKTLEETYRVLKPGGTLFILNHFTPANGLRYLDSAFQPLAKLFYFKSLFYSHSLTTLQKFTPVKEISFAPFSYFKL